MSDASSTTNAVGFRGTQVRDGHTGPLIVAHKQKLVVVEGPDKGLEKEFVTSHLTIGSAPGNDLVVTDTTVSRKHFEIVVQNDKYVIRDLESTNGTRVDGTSIVEAFLLPGSHIRAGETEFIFEPKKKWEAVKPLQTEKFGDMSGRSAAMREVFGLLEKVAKTDLSCIVVGETGTGKELAARAIHQNSPRANKPFIVVDCGAISATLIESELFGHERGAFTGADRQRQGAFELAEGGTVFLDEIGELPIELQPKLLRVLERREVRRLGAANTIRVDLRVIAATHRDLPRMVQSGGFREDVYYRLAEVVVNIPSLSERLEDIDVLIQRMIKEGADKGSVVRSATPEVIAFLKGQRWPGNVRELRNVIRRAVALASDPVLTLNDLKSAGTDQTGLKSIMPSERTDLVRVSHASSDGPAMVDDHLPIKEARERWLSPMEREYLVKLLNRCQGDLDIAAEQAGIHRKSLERLLRQHNITRGKG